MKTNEVPTPTPTGSASEPVPADQHTTVEPDTLPTDQDQVATADEPVADPTGQLLLLPELVATSESLSDSNEHARFRLSKQTRERGLRHVAEIRAQLAAAKERNAKSNVVSLPPRRTPAA